MSQTVTGNENMFHIVLRTCWGMRLSILLSMVFVAACNRQPLDEPIADEYLSDFSMEAHFPPDRVESIGDDLLSSIKDSGLDVIQIASVEINQAYDGGSYLALSTSDLDVTLSQVHPRGSPTGVNLHLVFAPSNANVDLEVSYMGTGTELCQGDLVLPAREAFVHLSLQNDSSGRAELVVDDDPGLSGDPVTILPNDGCQADEYMVEKAATLLDDGINEELARQLHDLLEQLRQLSTGAFGLDMGMSGTIGPNMLFSVFPENLATSSADTLDCRLDFTGGFESRRAWCVPSDVTPFLPNQTQRTAFSDTVPGSQDAYSVAISVSLDFLLQGILSAYRAGLLCRQATEFSLNYTDPVTLFPSMGQLGRVHGMRVSTRPMGIPNVSWHRPGNSPGSSLPDVFLVMPDVYMDVFISMDGLDMRAFEMRSDITVELEPVLEEGILSMLVAQVDVQQLEIEYNELSTERAGELRQSSIILVQQVIRQLLEPLENLSLDLPMYSGGNLLAYELDDKHLVLYLGFGPSAVD